MLLKLIELPWSVLDVCRRGKTHLKDAMWKVTCFIWLIYTRSEVEGRAEIFSGERYESLQGQEDAHGATDNLNEESPDGFQVNTSSFLATPAYLSIARHRGVSKPTAHPSLTSLHFIIDRKCTCGMLSWNSSWHDSEKKNHKRSARRKCKIV